MYIKTLMLAGLLVTSGVAQASDYVISTGGVGGGYEYLGANVANSIEAQSQRFKTPMDVTIINSNGSVENIENLNDGLAQAAIVQADALNVHSVNKPSKAKTAHTETVFWLYNKDNEFSDIEDIEGKEDVVMVLVDGSGAYVTMSSFAKEDSGYEVNLEKAVLVDDVYEAAEIVSEGRYNGKIVAGMLYVGSQIPSEIANDFRTSVYVGEATDKDFNDSEDAYGQPLYTNCEISSVQMKNMQKSGFGDPDTVCMKAMVVYLTDFDNRKIKKAVSRGINKATKNLD